MIQRVIPATLVALCTALPVHGADLTFSLGGTGEYDQNVFRTERDRKDDFLFTIRPGVRLHEDRGQDLNYSIGYQIPVEFATEFSKELNDVDQVADGRIEYRVNDRVTVTIEDRFRYLRSTLRQEREEAGTQTSLELIGQERDRVTLNNGAATISYLFNPRLVGRARVTSTFFDSTRDDRSQNYSVGTVLDGQYRLSQQHQVGGGARYGFQDFDDRQDVAGSTTHTVGVFGSWRWFIDETMDLSVTAGPTLLLSQQDRSDPTFLARAVPFERIPATALGQGFVNSDGFPISSAGPGSVLVQSFDQCASDNGQTVLPCPSSIVLDPAYGDDATTISEIAGASPVTVTNLARSGGDSRRLTAFAEIVLSKRWSPTLGTALSYSREQGNASGLGGAVVGDTVSLANTWDFAERWQLALRGDWTQRESVFRLRQTRLVAAGVTSAPGGVGTTGVPMASPGGTAFNSGLRTSIDTNRWSVAGRVTHRLFRSTVVFAQVRYDQQQSRSASLGRRSDFENLLAVIGFRHTFEPIKLW